MGKFLLGLVTGAVLVVLILVIGIFAVASLRSKPATIADGSTLILRLNGDVPEKPPVEFSIPFLSQRTPVTVENVWSMLRRAAADPRIKAVVFEPAGANVGWAKMQEIRADLDQFRKSGKPLIAYLKAPGAREYYMASACAKIYMSPVDVLNLKGIAFELMYFKNTLDKLGVHVDVEHAGKYKDYGDMFTRTSMSPETNEVMTGLADVIFNDLVTAIAKGRHKDPAAVRAIIDEGPFLSTKAKAKGLVDELRYEDEAFGELKATLLQSELKRTTAAEYAGVPDSAVGLGGRDQIAFVVAEGTITRGDPNSTNETGLESEVFDKMLARVANDKRVKGVIVRIDSPGGEVAASDDMWRAMNELRRKKPVVISMSDAAASGGYYMAMSGDALIAYPGTLTGSIGVVFGKPNLHGLYDKAGVSKDYISRGRFALIDSDYQSLSEAGRQKLREGIDATYEDFIGKVAAARKKSVSVIEPLAQGRVWLGEQAKTNGLVDELGGLDRAVEMIKAKSGIPAGNKVSLILYPPKRSVLEVMLRATSDAEADAFLSGVGLGTLRTAWHDARLRVWMQGGMLGMLPFSMEIR
jgi:protease IV